MKPEIIVIAGPTASGKTSLSIELAKKVGGEIISGDSMQIYKDMNIGTAKVTKEEMQGINHYLIDFLSPEKRYTVSNFKKDAEKAIEKILENGNIPIICGGTGLYIDSLIYEIEYQDMDFDKDYRDFLMEKSKTEEGLSLLYEEALRIDEKATLKISKNDKKRILRIIEIYHSTGKTKTELEILSRQKEKKYDFKVFALNMDRQLLYDRINNRVDLMLEKGLIEEVAYITKKYNELSTSGQGLGYKEIIEYLDNKITYGEMVEKIKKESRHYAKRQLTWFRKNKDIIWLNAENGIEKNIEIISSYINNVRKN